MRPLGNLAIIGSGASAIYLLNQIANHVDILSPILHSITILEKTSLAGCGMPYNPETTDIYNMSNISSEEIPELPESFYDWLQSCTPERLLKWGITHEGISESEVYGRLPLGAYLHAQYRKIVARIQKAGIHISEKTLCNVTDIIPDDSDGKLKIETSERDLMTFDSIVIATGHEWSEEDDLANGFYGSPWPISKILPAKGRFYNISIGTLGASLSAFDVVSSLSHRHGEYRSDGDDLSYHPYPGTENFRLSMHSSNGWLPHLQFDQAEPFRVIYRHVSRDEMFKLRNEKGLLRINDFFDKVCRPALIIAFSKDGLTDVASSLRSPMFGLEEFVELMEDKHEYDDAFVGMRQEMIEARASVENHKPIHWKEVMDDLMYTLNFHAELMPAEDHLVLRNTVMPFLMNVIAAMPLPSANLLLALNDAGKLDLVAGRVSIEEDGRGTGSTTIIVENGEKTKKITYGMFVDCSGQKSLELAQYPFQGLVNAGRVRRARSPFNSHELYKRMEQKGETEHLFKEGTDLLLHTGGVDIDAAYRIISEDGSPDSSVFDLAFPHTSGVRPYSYGLQACNTTAEIVVNSWLEAIDTNARIVGDIENASERYVEIQES